MGVLRDDLEAILRTRGLSRVLIDTAHRAGRRSAELCQSVHERRRRSDFFYRLAKQATVFPQRRRFLPLCGGDGDPLHIEKEELPESTMVRVSGEVDLANMSRLETALQPALSNCRNIILDISDLRYIDSTGLHVLFDVNEVLQQHSCQMIVAGPRPGVAKVFSIVHLDRSIPVVSSVEEARGLLHTRPSAAASDR